MAVHFTGIGDVYDPPLVGDVHDIDMDEVCACSGTCGASADTTARIANLIFTANSLRLSSLSELPVSLAVATTGVDAGDFS